MEPNLETLGRLIDTLIEFAVAYGFQILGALVFLAVGLKAAGWAARRTVALCERKDLDVTLSRFLGNVVRLVLIGFVAIITLGNFGITIAPLIALAGASAFGATFALQGPLSNYGAGLSIVLSRPFVVGDTVRVKGASGVVETVALAATVLRGEDGERITVPNKEIVGEILVNSDKWRIVETTLYLDAAADTARATEAVQAALADYAKSQSAPAPQAGIHDFAPGGIALGLRYWAPASKYFETRYTVNAAVKQAIDAAGIPLLAAPWPIAAPARG